MREIDLAHQLALYAVTERTDGDGVSATLTISDDRSGLNVNTTIRGVGQYAPEAYDDLARQLRAMDSC